MDKNVSVLQMVFGVKEYKSGDLRNLGAAPEGMVVDSVSGNTDMNHRVIQKNIKTTIQDGDIMISMDLPRKTSVTMFVTVWVAFKPV